MLGRSAVLSTNEKEMLQIILNDNLEKFVEIYNNSEQHEKQMYARCTCNLESIKCIEWLSINEPLFIYNNIQILASASIDILSIIMDKILEINMVQTYLLIEKLFSIEDPEFDFNKLFKNNKVTTDFTKFYIINNYDLRLIHCMNKLTDYDVIKRISTVAIKHWLFVASGRPLVGIIKTIKELMDKNGDTDPIVISLDDNIFYQPRIERFKILSKHFGTNIKFEFDISNLSNRSFGEYHGSSIYSFLKSKAFLQLNLNIDPYEVLCDLVSRSGVYGYKLIKGFNIPREIIKMWLSDKSNIIELMKINTLYLISSIIPSIAASFTSDERIKLFSWIPDKIVEVLGDEEYKKFLSNNIYQIVYEINRNNFYIHEDYLSWFVDNEIMNTRYSHEVTSIVTSSTLAYKTYRDNYTDDTFISF